jgi:methylated-DNA-[protein]-cysteine S-methyltransferase
MKKPGFKEFLVYAVEETPIGWVAPVSGELGLRSVMIERDRRRLVDRLQTEFPESCPLDPDNGLVYLQQLREYFSGKRRLFEVQIDLERQSDFSRRVLEALILIPFGKTVSYGELAGQAGFPRAARAVGRVMATNPLPLVLPCHRVLGAGGALTGYSGGNGIATKQWLINSKRIAMMKNAHDL